MVSDVTGVSLSPNNGAPLSLMTRIVFLSGNPIILIIDLK